MKEHPQSHAGSCSGKARTRLARGRTLFMLPYLGRGDLEMKNLLVCMMFHCIWVLACTQGTERREVAGKLSSSLFTAIKRELCSAMHFSISPMLLIISK